MSDQKIKLDFSNYPNLWRLMARDKQKFMEMSKGFLTLADRMVEEGVSDVPQKQFDIPIYELAEDLLLAVLDYDGMLNNHHDKHEAAALSILEHVNNPLAVLSGKATPRMANGEEITLEDWAGIDPHNLKEWLKMLMYSARYVSHKDLAKHLLLGEFDLMELEKSKYVKQLIRVQPALQWQKNHDIPIGKRVSGTGFFDLGRTSAYVNDCPACDSPNWNTEDREKYAFCLACYGGVLK